MSGAVEVAACRQNSNLEGYEKLQSILIPKIIVMSVISLLIVLSNGTLIFTIVTHRYLRKKSNYFVVALASSDLLLGLVSVPLLILGEAEVIARSYTGCLIVVAISCTQIILSLLMLSALSLERYLKFVHPFAYAKHVTKRRMYIVALSSVVYSVAFGFLPLLGWNSVEAASERDEPYACRFELVLRGSYLAVLFIGHILPPFIILPMTYMHVFFTAQRLLKRAYVHKRISKQLQSRKEGGVSTNSVKHMIKYRNYRHFKILVVMGLYFIVSWMPISIWEAFLFKGFTKESISIEDFFDPSWKIFVYYITIGLAIANSAVNPVIFGAGNTMIRKTLLRCLHKRRTASQSEMFNSFNSLTDARIRNMAEMCSDEQNTEAKTLLRNMSITINRRGS